ncbi:GNAT family N-acetyltransferase [Granulicella tundricola]|uniref:GCN5-related N-acetyltransferase n=1 Tax=Granulicella tundricola (strain ATCC BAA-1859 / DSM 23138 / MP5ACTX9) TaxID=1198114 RepID=E8X145_GRATM|nr:GNAT family N-acetyltransferase [Granulicella tundricola]ADW67911.1 GCN5-related N-acetyltransferase [Granulicella tundricola MP5ACTX9]
MPTVQIRPALPADVPLILHLVRELAIFEREPDAVKATEADLHRYGFGPEKQFDCLLAFIENEPAGLALYFFNYSTWTGKPGIHLEDLFVLPAFRKQGIGRALLSAVARIAVEKGLPRLQWDVLRWNEKAIAFYQAHGAHLKDDWGTMRVEAESLTALASQATPSS